ncbi:MAG: hypothetical protein R2735_01445 [Microthrixaceae bacterium]
MGSKRSARRMERLHNRFNEGSAANGVTPPVADAIWAKLAAFANYGFPESHSVSFVHLVYAPSWIKYHYPAAFLRSIVELAANGVLLAPESGRTPAATGWLSTNQI